ncbi:MAG TPA: flagella basal body P-ring formation protein FlgA [Limnochordales bacterium]
MRAAGWAALAIWLAVGGLTGAAEASEEPRPAPAAAGRVALELQARAETAGPVIRLGEVAAFAGGDGELWERLQGLEVGAAPLPGQSRLLTLGAVVQRLRQARVPPDAVQWVGSARSTVVTARGVPLEAGPIEAALREYLAGAAAAMPDEAVRVARVEVPADVMLPPGVVSAAVASGPPVLRPGPAVFAVDVAVDGAAQRRLWVKAELEPASGLPAPPAGRPAPEVASRPPAPAEAQGVGVARGAPVTLVVRRGAVTVTVGAVALEPASPGQPLKVQNPASGAMVQAVLVAPGLAVVDPTAGP